MAQRGGAVSAPNKTLQFLGGTGTVTGSKYLIEFQGKRILVDCGLFQGYKELRLRNREPFPVPADTIDTVLITHAHLDHSGYVPALVKAGFRGNILMSEGTAQLCSILWPDSAHLLEEEAERANRKKYTKHAPAKAIYTIDDVNQALGQVRTVRFDEVLNIAPDITAQFTHAGHILGASQLQVTVGGTRIHFTGDLGRAHDPLMKPPAPFGGSDVLITESTYGNREHPNIDPESELTAALKPVLERGGTVVIPSFAVGRTQALMLHIWRLMNSGVIPTAPIFVNSPMAQSATQMYHQHQEEHSIPTEEFQAMYDVAHMVRTVDESKALNERTDRKVIIAASGMMTGGRVLHHVVAFGQDPKNAIVISGYQAGGTRGRLLAEGAKTLRIFGADVAIKAEVVQLQSMSGHADANEILAWMGTASTAPRMTYVTHGEPDASDRMRYRIANELHWNARAPHDHETIDLDNPR
jgi:metallo-beta-lactamase family protein